MVEDEAVLEIDFKVNTVFLKGKLTQHLKFGDGFKNCDIALNGKTFVNDGTLDLSQFTTGTLDMSKCTQCGVYMNPVERAMGSVCGKCCKKNHKKVAGGNNG